jgi:FkbM family methyltransferase
MLSRADIEISFQTFLGRAPESEEVIVAHQMEPTLDHLGRRLMRTDEFRRRLHRDASSHQGTNWFCTEIRHGLKLWIDLNDSDVSAGCLRGDWEQAETDLILSLLSPGDTFIDVGASIGWFTVLAAHGVGPDGRVYAFEPRADRHERLTRSVEENGFEARVITEQAAVGAVETELGCVRAENKPGHGFLMPRPLIESAESFGTSKVLTLDSLAIERSVRVIRIGVEGAEPQVMAGARALIERDHPVLVLEIVPGRLSAMSNTTAAAFFDNVRSSGYHIHCLADYGLGRELRGGEEGVEFGRSENLTVVAIHEADHANLIAHRLDHRVDDLERCLLALARARAAAEARALVAERSAAQAARAAGDAKLLAQTHAAEADARVAEAERAVTDAWAEAETSAIHAEEAKHMAAVSEANNRRLSDEVSLAKQQLQAIESSTLWRITLPLRRASDAIPQNVRRSMRRVARLAWWIVTLQAPRRLREYRRLTRIPKASVAPLSPAALEALASLPATALAPTFWGEAFVVPFTPGPAAPACLPAATTPRVLIIDSRWPRPDRDSGSVDALLLVRAFRDFGYEVVFAGDAEFANDSPYRTFLEGEGVICLSPLICTSVENFLHRDGATLALCILSRVDCGGRYLEAVRYHAPRATIIFNPVDLHHLREVRAARIGGDIGALRRAEATSEREFYIVRQADATTVVSASERALLEEKVAGTAVFYMPLARPVRSHDVIPGFDARAGIGFVGGFDHGPNVDAIRFFLEKIWPLVTRALPEIEFSIVGADLPDRVLAGAPGSVRYLGPLPDLDAWLDRLRLTIAPLRYGAGAKGKIASSLAAGVPCVGTSIAAEGMGLSDGVDIAVGDTPEQFADRVVEVYRDRVIWSRLSAGGHALADKQFSVSAGKRRLAEALSDLSFPCRTAAAPGSPITITA